MEFINIAKQRQSVRSYNNKKVEPEKLEKILEAAHVAPTDRSKPPACSPDRCSERGRSCEDQQGRWHLRCATGNYRLRRPQQSMGTSLRPEADE